MTHMMGPRRICDIYDLFAPRINALTYLLTYLLTNNRTAALASNCDQRRADYGKERA